MEKQKVPFLLSTPTPQLGCCDHSSTRSSSNTFKASHSLLASTLDLQNLPQEESRFLSWRAQTDCSVFKIRLEQVLDCQNKMRVSFQKMQSSLMDLVPIRIDNLLYILKTVLINLEIVTHKLGYFYITPQMIGLNSQNQCKFWINEDLAFNHPQRLIQGGEAEMMENLLQIVEVACERQPRGELQQSFLSLLRNEGSSFVKAIQCIWKFSYENVILIPPCYQLGEEFCRRDSKMRKTHFIRQQNPRTHKRKNYSNIQQKITEKICWNSSQNYLTTKGTSSNSHPTINFHGLSNKRTGNVSNFHIHYANRQKGESPKKITCQSTTIAEFEKMGNMRSSKKKNSKSDFHKTNNIQNQADKMMEISENKSSQGGDISLNLQDPNAKCVSFEPLFEHSGKREHSNNLKMKEHIFQKIKKNQQKKSKITHLQEVHTIKSIGDFTESEKYVNLDKDYANAKLEMLGSMGRKIQKSLFCIDISSDDEQSFAQRHQRKSITLKAVSKPFKR